MKTITMCFDFVDDKLMCYNESKTEASSTLRRRIFKTEVSLEL